MRYLGYIVFFFLIPLYGISQEAGNELYHRADSLIRTGSYSEAIDAYRLFIGFEKSNEEPDWKKISESYNNIGVAYFYTRDYIGAAKAFEDGLAIDREYNPENIASRLSNLGMIYSKQGNYPQAIRNYEEALELAREDENKENISIYLNNIGAVYDSRGEYDKAIEYYQRSLRIKEEMGNREGIANSLSNIGLVYSAWKKYDQAVQNFKEALEIDTELGNKGKMAIRLNNIGLIFYELRNYDSALYYYEEALELNRELDLKDQVSFQYNNIGMIYFEKGDHASAGTYLELSLNVARELNLKADIARVLSNLGYNEGRLGNYTRALELLDESSEISEQINLLRQLQVNYRRLSEIAENMGDNKSALDYHRKAGDIKDSLFTREMHEQIADFEVMYETERKQREIELLKQREIISNLERRRDRAIRNSLIAGLMLLLSLAGVIFWSLRRRVRDNRLIAYEKGKSDRLLTNILPSKVAADLKETGTTKPESFSNVTVFFSDLVNFTQLSAGLEPEFIINELNKIFTKFDSIIEKHGCERIKTIGDAYMAVCGVPEPNPKSAVNIVEAAVEILDFMEERRKKSPVKWEVRIGVHTGDVVAGVVGVKKYIYDVFGDTVNMASRMESNSLPMKINVSEATYELAGQKFEFIEREPLEVKGKGKIRMYFVKGKR